jgi:hypothetical protein
MVELLILHRRPSFAGAVRTHCDVGSSGHVTVGRVPSVVKVPQESEEVSAIIFSSGNYCKITKMDGEYFRGRF